MSITGKSVFFNFSIFSIAALVLFSSPAIAQEKSKKQKATGKLVMWQAVNVSAQDTYLGPGGAAMQPDLSKINFLKEEKGGFSKKFRITDGAGREWVAKIGTEAQSETAAVRILHALGYKTEVNYLVPNLTIPGQGTFENVRLEARPEDVARRGRWDWEDNPFNGTNELQGLKIMMSLFNNWDTKDGNNIVLQKGTETHYVVSDLGATFGKTSGNNLPIFWRVGRSKNKPDEYIETDFIKEIENGKIDFSYIGENRSMFDDVTVQHGRWLADLLLQLTDKQFADAFRAANYAPEEIKTLTLAVKNRITALDRATRQTRAQK